MLHLPPLCAGRAQILRSCRAVQQSPQILGRHTACTIALPGTRSRPLLAAVGKRSRILSSWRPSSMMQALLAIMRRTCFAREPAVKHSVHPSAVKAILHMPAPGRCCPGRG